MGHVDKHGRVINSSAMLVISHTHSDDELTDTCVAPE